MFKRLISAGLLTTGTLLALDAAPEEKNYHCIYVKPDFFVGNSYDYHWPAESGLLNEKGDAPFYAGVNVAYEYNKPNSIYLDAQWAESTSTFDHHITFTNDSHVSTSIDASISNLEGCAGINFHQAKLTAIPFIGVGRYVESRYYEDWTGRPSEKVQQIYGALGNKLIYRFSPLFDLGLNAKIMRPAYLKAESKWFKEVRMANTLDYFFYEVSLPASWHLPDQWEIQAEPFLFTLSNSSADRFLGARLALGHTF
ncbi:MAG: hypothetical protein JSS32_08965 [Verrucomicrobia bacterium]|nr:hypothetical protein [Verrucomicrobiota bacterium]